MSVESSVRADRASMAEGPFPEHLKPELPMRDCWRAGRSQRPEPAPREPGRTRQ